VPSIPSPGNLQLRQKSLTLKQQNNLVHRRPDVRLGHINNEIRLLWRLIRIVDTSEALDLSGTCSSINAAAIRLLRVLERRRNVHKEERSVLLHRVLGRLSGLLERRDRRRNRRSTSLGKLCSDESDAGNVLVSVFAREAEFG
jgi:hypothetical protein